MADDIRQETMDEAERLRDFWRIRNNYLSEHRALVGGTYRDKIKGYELLLANEPKALLELSTAILGGKPPRVIIPVANEPEEERRPMNKTERWATAILLEWDRRYRRRLRGPWLHDLSWYTCMGASVLFPHIRNDGRRGLQFRCDIWDIMDVFPEPGDDGLNQVVRMYRTTRGTAKQMVRSSPGWNVTELESARGSDVDSVDVINRFWVEDDEVWNTVIIDEKVVLEPVERTEFRGQIPIIINGANGVPYRAYTDTRDNIDVSNVPDWRISWSRPITDTNASLYPQLDKLLSYMMQRAHDHAYGTLFHITRDGASVLTEKDLTLQEIKTLAGRTGDSAQWISPPPSPSEIPELLQYITGALARGGLDPVLYGNLGIEVSGVTLDRLIAGTKSKLQPYGESMSDGISQALTMTQVLFKRQRRKVELPFLDDDMRFYHEGFDPAEIQDTAYYRIEMPMALPDNTVQKLTAMQMAIGQGQPLMDFVTASEVLGKDLIPDAEVVRDRIDEMRAGESPILRGLAELEALEKKALYYEQSGEPQRAQLVRRWIEKQLGQLSSQVGLETNRPEQPGIPPEPRPEVMPAEAGPASPDEVNMAFGRQPTPPGGAEETAMGRRMRQMGVQ